MAKAFASFSDDDEEFNKRIREKPTSPDQVPEGLSDNHTEEDKKITDSTFPILKSPIWKNYKEKESVKASIDAQVTTRLAEELSTGNSSVADGQTQTVVLKSSYIDAWTQTEESLFTAKDVIPTPAPTKGSIETHTVVGDESYSCKDESSASPVADSIPASTPEEDSVMEEVGGPITNIQDIDQCMDITKAEKNESNPDSGENLAGLTNIIQNLDDSMEITKAEESESIPSEKWLGTSSCTWEILSNDKVSTCILRFRSLYPCNVAKYSLKQCERQRQVEGALQQRDGILGELAVFPYNPICYANLASAYNQLGFTDIAASNAYKAILLVECALYDSTTSYPSLPYLRENILTFMRLMLVTNSRCRIDDQLNEIRAYAYRELLFALKYSGAFWDGLLEGKKAKELYPGDRRILNLMDELRDNYLDRCKFSENNLDKNQQKTFSKRGKIITLQYPWLDAKLFYRTPEMLRQVNESLKTSCCEVKPVVFGADSRNLTPPAENTDVGSLGVFATKNILKGELFMVDHTVLSVTSVAGSKKHHCDACQSFLLYPYFPRENGPREKVYPKCCKSVAYCSIKCRDEAAGLHSVICGKPLDYLYEEVKVIQDAESQENGYMPRSLLLCRVIAAIIPEIRRTGTHPLQHNLTARLVANYSPANVRHEEKNSGTWTFKQNVVQPTKFLLQIGVDIFRTRNWDQEVIQTLDWRVQNNANMGLSSFYPKGSPESQQAKREGIDNLINSNSINPNYIFFNHSCLYNANWSGSTECDTDYRSMTDMKGNILGGGNSAVRCFAVRNIKKDEEIFISYVGETRKYKISAKKRKWCRDSLNKWFPGGCGCAICEEENRLKEAGNDRVGKEGEIKQETRTESGGEDTIMEGAKTVVFARKRTRAE